jgi:hypothetical protein
MSEITLREHMQRIAALGGKARAKKLSPRRRRAIARKGAATREANRDEQAKAANQRGARR